MKTGSIKMQIRVSTDTKHDASSVPFPRSDDAAAAVVRQSQPEKGPSDYSNNNPLPTMTMAPKKPRSPCSTVVSFDPEPPTVHVFCTTTTTTTPSEATDSTTNRSNSAVPFPHRPPKSICDCGHGLYTVLIPKVDPQASLGVTMGGISSKLIVGKVLVVHVQPHSPAALVGIQPGDMLAKVPCQNGPLSQWEANYLWEEETSCGQYLKLFVERSASLDGWLQKWTQRRHQRKERKTPPTNPNRKGDAKGCVHE